MADRPGFEELVATRSGALLRTAVLLTGDHHLGEDLLQTSLQKTYLRWRSLREPAAGEAYTRQVMVNLATRWWRRRWRGEVPTEDLPEHAGRDCYAEADQRDQLRRTLAGLPSRQRAMIVLRYFNDLSEVETADLLGVSVGTVKNSTHKALARLRAELTENWGTGLPLQPTPPTPRTKVIDLTEPAAEVAP